MEMRLINADALKITLDTFATLVGFGWVYDRGQVMECIDAAPTIATVKQKIEEDARALFQDQKPIVRCKDCKYWHTLFEPDGYCDCDDMWRSLVGETTEVEYIRTNEDFYCGYAEKKEGASGDE